MREHAAGPGDRAAAEKSLAGDAPQFSTGIDAAEALGPIARLDASDLGHLAEYANFQHAQARAFALRAVQYAIAAGEALFAAKELVAHGEWAPWLANNFEGSERTAQGYMRLAKLGEEKRNAVADLSLREALKAIATSTMATMSSSASAEWYTPADLGDLVTEVLGEINLDPCWHPASPVVARTTYTAEQDGLSRAWTGRVYMNPPYGEPIWIEKLVGHHEAGDVPEAIALVPARVDTEWFRRLDAYPRCFMWRRITFANAIYPAPFPVAIVYLGPNVARFVEVFGPPVGGIWVQLGWDAAA